MILMRDALAHMEKRGSDGKLLPFSCEFIAYSRQRGEGGKIVTIPQASLSYDKKQYSGKTAAIPTERTVSSGQPNHFANKTRNILLPNGEIRKMRIRMLITFNGQQVVY
jgi:hypothetical protein